MGKMPMPLYGATTQPARVMQAEHAAVRLDIRQGSPGHVVCRSSEFLYCPAPPKNVIRPGRNGLASLTVKPSTSRGMADRYLTVRQAG